MSDRVEFYMTVKAKLGREIKDEARRRMVKPADLVERLIEHIFGDKLVDAVLDEK